MPRIPGFYEYDDDDLTPGKKKEGGLHQNLFDSDGKLKGNARFVPDEKQAANPAPHETVYVHETVFVHHQPYDEERERQLAREHAEHERLQAQKQAEQAELIADIARYLITAATPHVKRLWRDKARPFMDKLQAKKSPRRAEKATAEQFTVVDGDVVDTSDELNLAAHAYSAAPDSGEARARYVAALAAHSYAGSARTFLPGEKADSLAQLQRRLSTLPPRSVEQFIQVMERDPAALNNDLSAELKRILAVD